MIAAPAHVGPTMTFLEELHAQRWDDHRYYHQSRINQTLHLISAISFCCVYVGVFVEPAVASIFGWIVPMWVRQVGHFFFEPKGYDHVNNASFEEKERIKVGYNLQRKLVLLLLWVALPVVLWYSPTTLAFLTDETGVAGLVERTGLAWLALAVIGLLARTVYLMATRGMQTGLVWLCKIVTDPYHDIKIYHRAPLHLLRGEFLDPMHHAGGR